MARTAVQTASSVVVRLCFAFVFIVNVQCALSFVIDPASYASGFQLSGLAGEIAVQGLGIAFLMWNCTYPLFIIRPHAHRALGVIVLVQQAVGLIGETALWCTLPAGNPALSASIGRFMTFDGIGLVIMAASFIWFLIYTERTQS